MDILVSTLTDGAHGAVHRDQRRISGTSFTIGRGTQCQIHLPDARVALVHGRITLGDEGALLEASPHRVVYNDREVERARLAVGDVIEVGPYVLIVEPPPANAALALSVRLSKRVSTKGSRALYRVLLRRPRLSRRRLSWIAFLGVLLLALGAPIASDLFPGEPVRALSLGFVQIWNPGPLSRGHANFGHDCRSCHEVAFMPVRDQACLSCHGAVGAHLGKDRKPVAMAAALGERGCGDCHRDHQGRAVAPRGQELCVDCHGGSAALRGEMLRATDFARDHPKFRLPSADRSKLKFNHTLHLDPAGVRRAGGARQVLNCERCHQSAEGGARMAPIVMEQHCRECHALTFDPQVSARQVPHGEVEDIETMLREFYARLLLGDMPPGVTPPAGLPRVRPGVVLTGAERTAAMKIADERARRALDELMQARAVCSTCHYTSRGKDGHWRVAPVELTEVWLPRSTFTHAKHSAQTCTSCHDVRASRRAEDLAMPDIASCRQCHGGGAAGQGRIASDCATCHRFHRAGS